MGVSRIIFTKNVHIPRKIFVNKSVVDPAFLKGEDQWVISNYARYTLFGKIQILHYYFKIYVCSCIKMANQTSIEKGAFNL